YPPAVRERKALDRPLPVYRRTTGRMGTQESRYRSRGGDRRRVEIKSPGEIRGSFFVCATCRTFSPLESDHNRCNMANALRRKSNLLASVHVFKRSCIIGTSPFPI